MGWVGWVFCTVFGVLLVQSGLGYLELAVGAFLAWLELIILKVIHQNPLNQVPSYLCVESFNFDET